jgi:small conductance mechanosensitive channel
VLRSGDNREITVPNSHIYSGVIINFSARDTRRIDLVIGIGYEDNIGLAKNTIEEIIGNNEHILKDPEPTIMVLELGESSIDIAVRPWVKSGDYWTTRADLLQTIKETFDEKGISIPYPQRDLHMIQASA